MRTHRNSNTENSGAKETHHLNHDMPNLRQTGKSIPSKGSTASIVKSNRHNFIGVYPWPVSMKVDQIKCIVLSTLFINFFKIRLSSCILVIARPANVRR